MPLQEHEQIKLKDEIQGTLGDKQAIDADPNRTPERDKAARYIINNVIAEDRWPVQMTQLEDETKEKLGENEGWSRQHMSNTVQYYFVGVDNDTLQPQMGDPVNDGSPMSASPGQTPPSESADAASDSTTVSDTKTVYVRVNDHIQEIEIEIPDDVDRSSYVRGYLDCRMNLTTFTEVE